MRRLPLLLLLLLPLALHAQVTVLQGTIKDLTSTPVSSGKVTFTLTPGVDTTISGNARFVSTPVPACNINGNGQLVAGNGGQCQVTNNAALTPAGTGYKVCIQAYFQTPGNCFNWYAMGGTVDISQVVPTPATSPSYSFVDLLTQQLINGQKTFNVPPISVMDPVTAQQLATKNYVDQQIKALPPPTGASQAYVQSAAQKAAQAATAGGLAMSADGSAGADDNITDTWYSDMTMSAGATVPGGWETVSGSWYTQNEHGNCGPCTVPAALVRSLGFGAAAPLTPGVRSLALTARMLYIPGANSNSYIGFNTAAIKTASTAGTQQFTVGFSATGFYFYNLGTGTQLVGAGAATVEQQTDSGWANAASSSYNPGDAGGAGWGPPGQGWYDVTMVYPNDATHTLYLSFVLEGGVNYSYAFALPGITLPALQNLEIGSANAQDEIGNVAYSINGGRGTTWNLPHRNGYRNPTILLRSPVAHNSWLWVAPAYDQHTKNKWVIETHGCCNNGQNIQRGYAPVANYLLQQGYSILAIDNTVQNPWGNAQAATDVRNAIAWARNILNLDQNGYSMCDSMGCLQMLNAIANGYMTPRAAVTFSGNTSATWGWGGGTGPDAGVFTAAFNITGANPQNVAMGPQSGFPAGFDPVLAPQASFPPMRLFCSLGDTVVDCVQNSQVLANRLAAAGDDAQWVPTGGNHEDPSNFNGPAVVGFFNQY